MAARLPPPSEPLGPTGAQVGRWRPKGARGPMGVFGTIALPRPLGSHRAAKVDWVARARPMGASVAL